MNILIRKIYQLSKKESQGFTLIELLVVIVILSVLAAVSLPSYLSQAGKARGSEAKSNLAVINRAQQVYRIENNTMATSLTALESQISGKFYTYAVTATNSNNATATALGIPALSTDLKNYSSSVTQVPSAPGTQDFFGNIICETLVNNSAPAPGTPPITQNTSGTCPATMKRVD